MVRQEDQLPSAGPFMLHAGKLQQRVAPLAADTGPVLPDVAVGAEDELLRVLQQDGAARPVITLHKNAAALVAVGSWSGADGGVFTSELALRLDIFVTSRCKMVPLPEPATSLSSWWKFLYGALLPAVPVVPVGTPPVPAIPDGITAFPDVPEPPSTPGPAVPEPVLTTDLAVPDLSARNLGSAAPDPEVSISVSSCRGGTSLQNVADDAVGGLPGALDGCSRGRWEWSAEAALLLFLTPLH